MKTIININFTQTLNEKSSFSMVLVFKKTKLISHGLKTFLYFYIFELQFNLPINELNDMFR